MQGRYWKRGGVISHHDRHRLRRGVLKRRRNGGRTLRGFRSGLQGSAWEGTGEAGIAGQGRDNGVIFRIASVAGGQGSVFLGRIEQAIVCEIDSRCGLSGSWWSFRALPGMPRAVNVVAAYPASAKRCGTSEATKPTKRSHWLRSPVSARVRCAVRVTPSMAEELFADSSFVVHSPYPFRGTFRAYFSSNSYDAICGSSRYRHYAPSPLPFTPPRQRRPAFWPDQRRLCRRGSGRRILYELKL